MPMDCRGNPCHEDRAFQWNARRRCDAIGTRDVQAGYEETNSSREVPGQLHPGQLLPDPNPTPN